MKKEFSRTVFRYVFEFMLAGFIGWLYEVVTVWIMWGYFSNRGMLHMPIVPIYAVGAFLLLAALREKKEVLFLFLSFLRSLRLFLSLERPICWSLSFTSNSGLTEAGNFLF